MKLTSVLSQRYSKEYAYITGSGTSGLYIALKALGLQHKFVAIPNNVCYSVPLAILLSENIPVFIDIELETLGLSLPSLVEHSKSIDAVIAVHGYGNVCNIERISSFCTEKNIPLIEDCAVAFGAHKHNIPVGNWGDISLFSFGAGKIIDVGHGGVVLTDDKMLYNEFIHIDEQLPILSSTHSDAIHSLGKFRKQLYNTYYLRDQFERCFEFRNKVDQLKEHFLFRFSSIYEETIVKDIEAIDSNIELREKNAIKLNNFLSDRSENIDIYKAAPGSVLWRYNLFIKKNRNQLLLSLLEKRYNVSSWYPSVDIFFMERTNDHIKTPNSDWVGDHILNLWINNEIDDDYLNNISQDVLQFDSVL